MVVCVAAAKGRSDSHRAAIHPNVVRPCATAMGAVARSDSARVAFRNSGRTSVSAHPRLSGGFSRCSSRLRRLRRGGANQQPMSAFRNFEFPSRHAFVRGCASSWLGDIYDRPRLPSLRAGGSGEVVPGAIEVFFARHDSFFRTFAKSSTPHRISCPLMAANPSCRPSREAGPR